MVHSRPHHQGPYSLQTAPEEATQTLPEVVAPVGEVTGTRTRAELELPSEDELQRPSAEEEEEPPRLDSPFATEVANEDTAGAPLAERLDHHNPLAAVVHLVEDYSLYPLPPSLTGGVK